MSKNDDNRQRKSDFNSGAYLSNRFSMGVPEKGSNYGTLKSLGKHLLGLVVIIIIFIILAMIF